MYTLYKCVHVYLVVKFFTAALSRKQQDNFNEGLEEFLKTSKEMAQKVVSKCQ